MQSVISVSVCDIQVFLVPVIMLTIFPHWILLKLKSESYAGY